MDSCYHVCYRLRTIGWTISPDFSLYYDMVPAQKRWNSYRNKFLAAFWQSYGIPVIPAPSWGDLDNINEYLNGWPSDSIIAINSTGAAIDKRARHIWLESYKRMVELLHPVHILRYGSKIAGEYEAISTYYPNNNQQCK